MMNDRDYVSFSEIYAFEECPQKHHLTYKKGIRKDTIYTIFGKAIHEAIDKKDSSNIANYLLEYIKDNPINELTGEAIKADEWIKQAHQIYTEYIVWLEAQFPGYTLVASEGELEGQLEGTTLKFKGIMDYLIKDKDGVYHLLDFKTMKRFWAHPYLPSTKKQYQIILYKHFACQKYNIEPENMMTHYVMMRRQISKKNDNIRLFSVTSGSKKIKNALEWVNKTIKSIERNIQIANPSNCPFCMCGARKR